MHINILFYRTLRDFGFGKSGMEALIQDEILHLLEMMDKDLGQETSISLKFGTSVVNALWTIITGQRYEQDDKVQ